MRGAKIPRNLTHTIQYPTIVFLPSRNQNQDISPLRMCRRLTSCRSKKRPLCLGFFVSWGGKFRDLGRRAELLNFFGSMWTFIVKSRFIDLTIILLDSGMIVRSSFKRPTWQNSREMITIAFLIRHVFLPTQTIIETPSYLAVWLG